MSKHDPSLRSALTSSPLADLLALRSALELPIVGRHSLDPDVLRHVAEVDRAGDLTRFNVCEVPELAHPSSPDRLLSPDEHGWALGHALTLAIEHGQRLWVCEMSLDQLERLRAALGEDLVHIATLPQDGSNASPDPADASAAAVTADSATAAETAEEADTTDPASAVVVAVSPRALLDAWAHGTPEQVRYLCTVLEGTDPLRVSRNILTSLREAGVNLVPRASIVRLLHNPRFLAYATVFVYSSLRVLPASFAPGFQGKPWVLWTIDITTALPYTWGIIAMVAGHRLRTRILGFLVTLITFIAPYVYFFTRGREYPSWVIVVVVALVLGTLLLEGGRWIRDSAVSKRLRAKGRRGRK